MKKEKEETMMVINNVIKNMLTKLYGVSTFTYSTTDDNVITIKDKVKEINLNKLYGDFKTFTQMERHNFRIYLDKKLQEGEITLFQHSFLCYIYFFITKYGKYEYNRKNVENLYSETMTPEQIKEEIDDLVQRKWVAKESKKVIYDGKYVTRTFFRI